ncbi:MAG: peptidyl-prolyl cis-trans isomerase [Polyangiaceae bacterium]|nr:peptidyl-prolyl cis-trans isomerase [Polyangiaceae bacterium]
MLSPVSAVRRVFGEPLVLFLLAGLGLFLLHRAVAPPRRDLIHITVPFAKALRDDYQKRTGRPPTKEDSDTLIERFIDEEVLYREALVMGLDKGDLIVRRRLVQKMELVGRDSVAEPTQEELLAYYTLHAERYQVAPTVSFKHVFVSSKGNRGDAHTTAQNLFEQIQNGADPSTLGETFANGATFSQRSEIEIENLFGAAFKETAFSQPPEKWSRPVLSHFGYHLIWVIERRPASLAPLSTVQNLVRNEVLGEKRDAAARRQTDTLRARYVIQMDPGVN